MSSSGFLRQEAEIKVRFEIFPTGERKGLGDGKMSFPPRTGFLYLVFEDVSCLHINPQGL